LIHNDSFTSTGLKVVIAGAKVTIAGVFTQIALRFVAEKAVFGCPFTEFRKKCGILPVRYLTK
jgi:hypothetical protein